MHAILRAGLLVLPLLTASAFGQEQWVTDYFGANTDTVLNSVYFTGEDTGYVVGRFGKIIKHTADNGWQDQASGVTNHLFSVHFPTKTTGYAVGASGTILKTTNGGNSWVLKPSGTTRELHSVNFSSANSGYAVGLGGTILKTTDGGTSWSETIYGNGQSELNAVQMLDANKGFIAAYYNNGFILTTTNAGTNWDLVPTPNGSSWRGLHFPSANVGYVIGGGGAPYFSKTTDGGSTWSEATNINAPGGGFTPQAIHFINKDTGYVVGDGVNIAKTTNGGNTWTYPGQLLGGGHYLTSLYFTSANIGYAAGPNRVFKHVYTPPGVPTLSAPAANAQNTALNLNLTWGVIAAAISFRAQASTDSTFASTVFDDSTLLSATAFLENLSTNTKYYWRVNAKNPGGTSDWSTVRSFTTVPPIPPAPALLLPVDGGTNLALSPTLSWNPASGAATYRLQVSTNAGFTALIKDTTTAITSKLLGPPLANNTLYYWRVSATNAGGTSAYSTTSTFTTVPIPAPPTLSSPGQGAINTALSLNLTWDASANALTYRVQLSTDSNFATTTVNDSTLTGTIRAVGPLANNTTYYWRVNAKNGGTSAYSSVLRFTTLPAVPAVPSLTTPAAAAINVPLSSSLAWGAVSGAATYRVQLSADSTFATTVVNDSTVTATTIPFGPLVPGTMYFWRVNAKNAGGTSAFPTFRRFTTVPAIPPTPAPSSPAANATGISVSTSLNWVAAAGAVSYTVQLSTDSTFAAFTLLDSTVTATTRAVSSLLNNTVYYWRVNAKNPGGTGPFSAIQKFTTIAVPVPALTAPANNATGVALSTALTWSAAAGVTSYHVQLSSDSLFASLVVNDSGLTSATRNVGPLAAGTSYFWRVRAKAPGGTGDWSATQKFTILVIAPAPVLSSPGVDSVNVPTSPSLVWQTAAGAATYRVQLSSDSLFASLVVDDSTLTATTRAVGPLNNAAIYYWRVNAKNGAGTSAFSTRRKFTTVALAVPSLTTPAANATGISVVNTLSWTAVAGATGYTVQVSTDSLFSTLAVNDIVNGATTRQVGPLSAGTAYFWRVRGQNTGSNGAFSAAAKFTTMALPAVPTLSSPAADTVGVPLSGNLVWAAASGAATYRVQLSTDSTFATTLVNDSTLTAATRAFGSLTNSTTYYWRVNAKNGGGTSAYSSTRRFVTVPPTSLAWAHIVLKGPSLADGAALRFQLPAASRVRVRLYDSKGVLIAGLMDDERSAGSHTVPLSSYQPGLYLLDFRAGEYRQILKLVR